MHKTIEGTKINRKKIGLETADMTFLIEMGERKFKWFLEHIEREWCAF